MTADPTPANTEQRLGTESVAGRADLADYLGDMISAHAPDGTYRYVSAASEELLGYAPSELVGTWAYDHFHPDDIAKVAAVHRSALGGAPVTTTYRLRRKSGDYVWVETTTRTINHEGSDEVAEMLCCTRPIQSQSAIEKLLSEGYEAISKRIENVLRTESIEPAFQPILELDTGRVIAYEALARFPGDQTRTPDLWFADAWAVGLGVPLELLAVRVAARALPRLPANVDLTVNASPPTVSSGGFLKCFGGAETRVAVELTEHLEVDDYAGFRSKLRPLREAGGKVAIDDFGAGYASLRHILKVSPEWIKLDISLTERIHEDPVAHALATSLISFADEVGVRVIAEGIETDEELDALTEIGFRYGQGFYFGVPGPLEEVLQA
jgi:PAS domain S-box-containing protein